MVYRILTANFLACGCPVRRRKTKTRHITAPPSAPHPSSLSTFFRPQFLALQKRLAAHESTIQTLHKTLDAKEAQQEKLKHDAVCGSAVQRDVDTLMVRAATLEQALLKVRQNRGGGWWRWTRRGKTPAVKTGQHRSRRSA